MAYIDGGEEWGACIALFYRLTPKFRPHFDKFYDADSDCQ